MEAVRPLPEQVQALEAESASMTTGLRRLEASVAGMAPSLQRLEGEVAVLSPLPREMERLQALAPAVRKVSDGASDLACLLVCLPGRRPGG